MTALDNQAIHNAAAQAGCKAEIVQETTVKWCNTWQPPMRHERTSQGWQCMCGELVPFDDSDLGTRMIVSDGEVRELPLQTSSDDEIPF